MSTGLFPSTTIPVMLVGHSLLALIAAAVGGVAAPIVSRLCGRQPLAGIAPHLRSRSSKLSSIAVKLGLRSS